ncbi:hypothetical protein [Streptomyces sp. NPDC006193]|uniref:hypothetical protein n=1 Tax=Streptomyces sp. NPDC006193 TaxID=3155717 RepID=UPI0033B75F29
MSTTHTPSPRNQEPEPVRPWFARLFRRPGTTAAPSETARWKARAESAERERDAAYRERAQLLAWLAALHPSSAVITPAADVDEDGWQLLYLVAGGWQMSWHIHPADAGLFRHVTAVSPGDPRARWDGHDTEQKYKRLRSHVRLLALANLVGDSPSTGVVDEVGAAVLEEAADHLVRRASELWAPSTPAHAVMIADAAELRDLARRRLPQGSTEVPSA